MIFIKLFKLSNLQNNLPKNAEKITERDNTNSFLEKKFPEISQFDKCFNQLMKI